MVLALIFLGSSLHADNPFLSLQSQYLGQGVMVTPTGQKINYASYATGVNFASDNGQLSTLLTLGYFRFGQPLSYSLDISWDQFGFAKVTITYVDAKNVPVSEEGYGYCSENSCHINFIMEEKSVEETITISADGSTLERLGSIQYRDSQGKPLMAYWRETMSALQSPPLF